MNITLRKIQITVASIFCVSFPIIFAAVVYSAISKEYTQEISKSSNLEKTCHSNTWIKLIVAVFLAALFNSKKMLKIGTI